jgi:DMSO/TMAO reductase YedYZ molybdopterin-dependent catalytic subunit
MAADKSISRRAWMRAVTLAGLASAVPKAAWAFFLKRFPVRTVERKDFKFDPVAGLLTWRDGRKEAYALRVDGLVERPLELSYQDLSALPQVEQTSDFHCVEGWSVADLGWGGFRLKEVLDRAGLKPGASHVIFHALGSTANTPGGLNHYVESHPISALNDPSKEILLAMRLNDQPLPLEHGAPLRLIAPYDLAYKSIKFVTRLEVSDHARPGWWTEANSIYPIEAPVPPSRLRKKDKG